jgi:hypothetical protein
MVKIIYSDISQGKQMIQVMQGLPAIGVEIPKSMVEIEEKMFVLHNAM